MREQSMKNAERRVTRKRFPCRQPGFYLFICKCSERTPYSNHFFQELMKYAPRLWKHPLATKETHPLLWEHSVTCGRERDRVCVCSKPLFSWTEHLDFLHCPWLIDIHAGRYLNSPSQVSCFLGQTLTTSPFPTLTPNEKFSLDP